MTYFLSTLLVFGLALIETSFLPHFKFFGVIPALTLVFLICLSVRTKFLFQYFLAFFVGLYFDFLSTTTPGLYVGLFVFSVILGQLFFYRETNYNVSTSLLWLIGIGSVLSYAIQFPVLVSSRYFGWQFFLLKIILGTLLNFFVGYLIYRFLDKYFDWINKMGEERFR